MLVIELDDSSHAAPERQERDVFVDRCLAAAGLPVLRVACKRTYDPRRLAGEIQSRIGNG